MFDYYRNESNIKHEKLPVDDYITTPKNSGYRGIHLVYRYYSDKQKQIYNGMKIEVQLRSKHQHAWATAVETVGTFSGQALKSSLGSGEWQRFFALMSSAIALREKTASAPATPLKRSELIGELKRYADTLQVESRLREYGNALQAISSESTNAYYFLLELDPKAGQLKVTGFDLQQGQEAEDKYAEAEQLVRESQGTDAVLVSVESVNALAKAYPNYFADTRLFVELLSQALSGHSRRVSVPELKIGNS